MKGERNKGGDYIAKKRKTRSENFTTKAIQPGFSLIIKGHRVVYGPCSWIK